MLIKWFEEYKLRTDSSSSEPGELEKEIKNEKTVSVFYDRLTHLPNANQLTAKDREQIGGEVTVNLLRTNSMRPDGADDPTLGFNPKKDRIDKLLLSYVTGGAEIGI